MLVCAVRRSIACVQLKLGFARNFRLRSSWWNR